jgi:subtilisin family serine protease
MYQVAWRAHVVAPLDLVKLPPLMARTLGRTEIMVGLIDGPIAMNHAELAPNIREVNESIKNACTGPNSIACLHGTFVAGVLCARRGTSAPAICPNCTLLVRQVFTERDPRNLHAPSATPQELAAAILECIGAGVRVINLSLALKEASTKSERELQTALDRAAERKVVVVAAAGNEGAVGSSAITRHPWVIPVVSYGPQGIPLRHSNFGGSIGRRGLGAPGAKVTSLGVDGEPVTLTGTSVAAPFVTGAIALLWSEFPAATAARIKYAIAQASAARRKSIVPPLLDAWAAYRLMHSDPINGAQA